MFMGATSDHRQNRTLLRPGPERETHGPVGYSGGIDANVFLPDLPDGNDLVPNLTTSPTKAAPPTRERRGVR